MGPGVWRMAVGREPAAGAHWACLSFVPLNQTLAPRVSRPALVCWRHVPASWRGAVVAQECIDLGAQWSAVS